MEEERLAMTELKAGDAVFVIGEGRAPRHGFIDSIEYKYDGHDDSVDSFYYVVFNDYPKNYYEMMVDEPTGRYKKEDLVLDRNYKNVYEL